MYDMMSGRPAGERVDRARKALRKALAAAPLSWTAHRIDKYLSLR
jgi:hypothetical protein